MDKFFKMLSIKSPYGIVVFNEDGIKFINEAFAKLTGYSKKEIVRLKNPQVLFKEVSNLHLSGMITASLRKTLKIISTKDNREVVCAVTRRKFSVGKEVYSALFIRDVTPWFMFYRERLQISNFAHIIADKANDGIYIREFDSGRIIYANKRFAQLHGLPLDKIIGVRSHDLLADDEREKVKTILQGKIPKKVELKIKSRKGLKFIEETVGIIKEGNVPKYLFGVVRDITDKKKYEEQLQKMAIIDGLTGLYNRHFLNEFLKKEWERCKRYDIPISLIFMDIDGFKDINDRLGHLVGDWVLKEFGKILIKTIRDSDYAVRFGGDEFLIVLTNTFEGIEIAKERIIANLRKWTEKHKGKGIVLSASFGTGTFYPAKGDKLTDSLNTLDKLMYRDKIGKGNLPKT